MVLGRRGLVVLGGPGLRDGFGGGRRCVALARVIAVADRPGSASLHLRAAGLARLRRFGGFSA
jgi:hypothetical protein